jgi:hypothetical protein
MDGKKPAYPAFRLDPLTFPNLMKDVVFYGGEDLIRSFSTFTLLLPILAILAKRSMWHPCMAALLVYYTQFFFFSLITNEYVDAPGAVESLISFSHVLFDLPLILLFMQYFTDVPATRKKIRYALAAWVGMGILLTIRTGLTDRTITLLMGPGLLIADIFSTAFFVKYIQDGIRQRSETGKAFMAGSLVFLYGSYSLIYFIRYILVSATQEETYTLFQISSIISATLMAIGILLNRKKPALPVEVKKPRSVTPESWEDFQFK